MVPWKQSALTTTTTTTTPTTIATATTTDAGGPVIVVVVVHVGPRFRRGQFGSDRPPTSLRLLKTRQPIRLGQQREVTSQDTAQTLVPQKDASAALMRRSRAAMTSTRVQEERSKQAPSRLLVFESGPYGEAPSNTTKRSHLSFASPTDTLIVCCRRICGALYDVCFHYICPPRAAVLEMDSAGDSSHAKQGVIRRRSCESISKRGERRSSAYTRYKRENLAMEYNILSSQTAVVCTIMHTEN